ncbi:hypothetical protein C0J52_06301 [Blattella germanica]|nr:hypothetical protein C0J52_06301 [Blattella germanica]
MLLCIFFAPSCAEFGLHNFTQGMKFREERNAIWDPPFQGAIYIPGDETAFHESYARQRGDRNVQQVTVEFHPLCEVVTRRVELTDTEYEYRPPHYHEKLCQSYEEEESPVTNNNQMCTFQCVQRTNTIYLTRRRYDSNCWETFTKNIASSCECMLPERRFAPTG